MLLIGAANGPQKVIAVSQVKHVQPIRPLLYANAIKQAKEDTELQRLRKQHLHLARAIEGKMVYSTDCGSALLHSIRTAAI